MRTNKVLSTFFILIFSWLTCVSTAQASAGDPVGLLQTIANHMITGLREHEANLKSNPQVVYALAYRYVVPYADLSEMSKRVLSPAVWNSATPAQRAQFEKEFTKTVIRTYASALTNYKDQSVKFFPVRGGSDGARTVEVSSEIVSSQSQPISVTYRLINDGGRWKLYDMSVEGVDMLQSFSEQFAEILSNGNMSQLLQQLSGHNNR